MHLTDRASCLRALLRLVNAEDGDDDATEHDLEANEVFYRALQQGAEDAQTFMLDVGRGDWWLTTSSAISWTGSDPDRYWALPEDFLRAAGDFDASPFRASDGSKLWGRQVAVLERFRCTGDAWYFRSGDDGEPRVYLARKANPLSDMVMDYYRTVGELEDDVDVDFPELDRILIPAYAAAIAMEESWFPGGDEQRAAIARNKKRSEDAAWRRARRTQQPRMIKSSVGMGEHWML